MQYFFFTFECHAWIMIVSIVNEAPAPWTTGTRTENRSWWPGWAGPIQEEGDYQHVQTSNNCGLGCLTTIADFFCHWLSSQFFSWLMTALAIPSSYPCIETYPFSCLQGPAKVWISKTLIWLGISDQPNRPTSPGTLFTKLTYIFDVSFGHFL
jgi:hypothetical protein